MKNSYTLKAIPATLALLFAGVLPLHAQVEAPTEAPQATDDTASGPNPLRDSVIKGLNNNPMLNAEINGLSAQIEESNVRFGGLLPTVDIRGSAGRERSKIQDGPTRTYNASSYGIEARQNIFSGFAGQAKYLASYSDAMGGYYRYLNKANQVAFEASGAHVDVSRAQALTKLAESNLKVHQDLMARIEDKVKSGVTRESDLEQAKSRYTLALSNLATEKANTFTAMSNYQRVTDTVWPINQMGEYVVQANFEVENLERLVFALNTHPLLMAANAQIESAKQQVTASAEGFYPRFDLRAKSDNYSNYLSTFDDRTITSIDLLASMNLYRGGSDSASRNAAIKRKMRSFDDKLVVCRGIRQNSQNALYDVVNLQKRVNYFRAQAQAISKARAAYEQQFNVGRRSLLDLLTAENEYYQAQRGLINVEADLSVAKLRLLSATGQLINLFAVDDLVRADEPVKKQVLFYKEQVSEGAESEGCPAELINIQDFQMPAIGFDESYKSVQTLPVAPSTSGQAGAAEPAPASAKLLPPGTAAADFKEGMMPVNQPATGTAKTGTSLRSDQSASIGDPAHVSRNLIERTRLWAQAWMERDVNAYIGFYSPTFKPEQGSYESWEANRRDRLRGASKIEIDIADIQVVPSFDDPSLYELSFTQSYRSNNYQEKSRKTLVWKQISGKWQIIREKNAPINTAAKPSSSSKAIEAQSQPVNMALVLSQSLQQ